MRAKEVDSLRRLADEQAERLAYGRSLAAELTAVEVCVAVAITNGCHSVACAPTVANPAANQDELRMVRNQYLESIAVCDDRDARLKVRPRRVS
jgi:hypothetical protein